MLPATTMCYIKMSRIPAILSVILLSGPLPAQESPKPFVTYPGPVGDYLKRIQQGRQAHSLDASVRFGQWQEKARGALIELTLPRLDVEKIADGDAEGPVDDGMAGLQGSGVHSRM